MAIIITSKNPDDEGNILSFIYNPVWDGDLSKYVDSGDWKVQIMTPVNPEPTDSEDG